MTKLIQKIEENGDFAGKFKWTDDISSVDESTVFPEDPLKYYLDLLDKSGYRGGLDLPDPVFENFHTNYEDGDTREVTVIREDLLNTGAKTRYAAPLVEADEKECLVYVAPRAGYAPISLSYLAETYGKRIVLFCPAAEKPSPLQALCADFGAELRFVKIAAMPVLNKYAREWAEENQATYLAPGLHHPLVTAGIVHTFSQYEAPKRIWVATSTGTLARALQIAWPTTEVVCLLVARSMQDGQLGRALAVPSKQDFLQNAKILPPYDSASCYDAKLWQYVQKYAEDGDLVFNVGGNPPPPSEASLAINSQREWHDLSDLERK